jgi:hypothetical protein
LNRSRSVRSDHKQRKAPTEGSNSGYWRTHGLS